MEETRVKSNAKNLDLVQNAKNVLTLNWTGSFTKPARNLYPHQWAWDAALIAIGRAHYDQQKAEQELRHLFSGQWKNGMIPHIVFNSENFEGSYFPGPNFWQTERSPNAPHLPQTSGICQPPVHATAIRHILKYGRDKESARSFASELFPKIKAWQDFLYRERDFENNGIVYIRHPWESGQDNSPAFDPALDKIQPDPRQLPKYEREDKKYVAADERPSDSSYDKYVYLVDLFRKNDYDEKRIREQGCPFMIQDVLFNSLLCRAGNDLAAIAKILGKDPAPIKERADKTAAAIDTRLWDEEEGFYFDFDLVSGKRIRSHELSGFIPLFAEIPNDKRAEKLFNRLNTSDFCRLSDSCLAVPSFDRREAGYSPTDYWRGPIWINLNWMLREGLIPYGHKEYTQKIKNTIFELVKASGFHEYYDPDTGEGYGSDHFSWSASLFLDIFYKTGES